MERHRIKDTFLPCWKGPYLAWCPEWTAAPISDTCLRLRPALPDWDKKMVTSEEDGWPKMLDQVYMVITLTAAHTFAYEPSVFLPWPQSFSSFQSPCWPLSGWDLPIILFYFFLFRAEPGHMEVPRQGVKLELQLPAYTTATATPNLRLVCTLHHSSQQCWIPNPLSRARDRTAFLWMLFSSIAAEPQWEVPCHSLSLLHAHFPHSIDHMVWLYIHLLVCLFF